MDKTLIVSDQTNNTKKKVNSFNLSDIDMDTI